MAEIAKKETVDLLFRVLENYTRHLRTVFHDNSQNAIGIVLDDFKRNIENVEKEKTMLFEQEKGHLSAYIKANKSILLNALSLYINNLNNAKETLGKEFGDEPDFYLTKQEIKFAEDLKGDISKL